MFTAALECVMPYGADFYFYFFFLKLSHRSFGLMVVWLALDTGTMLLPGGYLRCLVPLLTGELSLRK